MAPRGSRRAVARPSVSPCSRAATAAFLRIIGQTPPADSTSAVATSSVSASETEGPASSLPREPERSSSLADPLAGSPSVGRRVRVAIPPRVAPSSVPKPGLATQAKVSATPTLQAVVAARPETPRVIRDLRAGLGAPVEARSAHVALPPPPRRPQLLRLCCRRCSKQYGKNPAVVCSRPSPGLRCSSCAKGKKPCLPVPESCVGTLRSVQMAARRVLDLRRPRHVHVEGRKAKLDSAVARLTRRQAHYDRELMVEQRVAAALEEAKNPATALVPYFVDLITETGEPAASPPPSPAREGLVLTESEEEGE
ncbi:MAG: hypothetical protein M1840_004249 [Geoglossum simile]|nr:MAG: hypothetical protein M1840_004249 [Geoglossum simile]